MTPKAAEREPARSRLCDFIRQQQHDIIADWSDRARALSPARDLSRAAIVDHLPQILDRIADFAELVHAGAPASLGDTPRKHAVDRLGRGFDLDQVVTEYGMLRRTILDLWESRIGPTIDLGELRNLDAAFDESIRQSTIRYAQAREKLLKALDRISEAALGSSDLDAFLNDLLRATLESTESVDTAVVLLRDGDTLRVHAAVGLEEDLRRGFSIAMGEGFAGRVAAQGQPMFLRHAALDPLVISQTIRDKGVHALYGVPLTRDGKVIGVAHIGSLTAFEFSDEDKLLFRSMVSRATSVIVQAKLVADLRRAIQVREHVLAIVSHDLRNQLGVVVMGATLLSRKTAAFDAADIKKPIETIRRTAVSMQHLVGDLLDMASIQAGRLAIEPQVVEIKTLLIESGESHEPIARNRGLRLRSELSVDGVDVPCDRDRILQVVANLLGNAIKFCEAGDTIVLRADVRDGAVLVAVSDTGPGIPPEERERIFEPYRTIEREGKTGTGLGLYITRGIVDRHGGRIWVESEVGRGTTFFFTLPLA